MAKLLQLRGGTTLEHSTFTGAVREVTVDTDKDTLVVHDGATAGGIPLLKNADIGTTVQAYDATIVVDADIGVTANKLVQLDSNAKLPAVDGSNLTNLPSQAVGLSIVFGS